jgi:dTDP-4-amino-4,6-dideoxygalactose transaminase
MLGVNSRMDSLQAVVLSAKLPLLDTWNAFRRDAAQYYMSLLQGVEDVIPPEELQAERHVWHLYVIRVDDRDQVLHGLAARGVSAGIHYPVPIHLLPPFSSLGARGEFPRAERYAEQIISLPIFPGITRNQQARVVDALVTSIGSNRTGCAR